MIKQFQDMLNIVAIELEKRLTKRLKIDIKKNCEDENEFSKLKFKTFHRKRDLKYLCIFLIDTEEDEQISRKLEELRNLVASKSSFEISQNLIKELLKLLEENVHAQKMREDLTKLATHLIKRELSR